MVMKSGLMLGVNPNAEREENDYYATNPKAIETFLNEYKDLNTLVWEPSCGEKHLSNYLEEEGYIVSSTDLINRCGLPEENVYDFLGDTVSHFAGDIITNPPFKLAEKFVEKGMSVINEGNHLILFLKIQFLEGQKRKELFKKYPPKYVYCHSSRQTCAKNGEFHKYKAATQFYAWYVWEKGFTGDTIIKWI